VTQPWARIAIVNFNGAAWLQKAVDALGRQTFEHFEAVIVDNASTDDSLTALTLPDARFSVLRLSSNLGFAAANNLAFRDCQTPWLATLNPDAFPEPDWLDQLRSGVARHPDVAMFGSTQIDATDRGTLDGCGDCYSVFGFPWRGGQGQPVSAAPADDIEVFAPCAAAALYRRDAYEAVGGFDERFFCYLEDVDLGFRLRLFGHCCVQLRRALVYHVGSALSGRDSAFTLFQSYRNRVWLIVKDVPFPLVLLMLPYHVGLCLRDILHLRGTRDDSAPLKGLIAGILGVPRQLLARWRIQRARRAGWRDIASMLAWEKQMMVERRVIVLGARSRAGVVRRAAG